MENSIYLGLSKQLALRTDMAIIANNLANMNTTGYRGQNTLFQEYVSDPKGNEDPLSFVYDYGHYQVTKEGPVSQTGNQLDIALGGPGFIGVTHLDTNETVYTRAGDFQMDVAGTLITSAGHPVASAAGAAITIPAGSEFIKIDNNGVVSNQDGALGTIMIVEFEDIQSMEALGDNLYKTGADAVPATETVVKQGYLEGSNVNSIVEMTRMIDTLRTFQSQNDIMKKENERLRTAIQKLTKTN